MMVDQGIGTSSVDFYGRISLDLIKKEGQTPYNTMATLAPIMGQCKYIVGHNIDFDLRFITSYFTRFNIKVTTPIKIDTMKYAKNHVKSLNKNGKIKNPKLDETYKYFTGKEVNCDSAHNGIYDVKLTLKCIRVMVNRKLIDLI